MTVIEAIAGFTSGVKFDELPDFVVEESKRLLVDSIGCGLGGLSHSKGTIGVEYARIMGAGKPEDRAGVLGTTDRLSIVAAAFANAELMGALDYTAMLFPGHVSPYVIPGILAVGEARRASGKEILCAVALAHEMSFRISKSMVTLRDLDEEGNSSPPPVYGMSSTVFGATAAISRLMGQSQRATANAIGIASSTSPTNTQWAWSRHAPTTTIKYTMHGQIAQTAMTAAHMAEMGHRGDLQNFDDAEYGYPRFIGSARWAPQNMTNGLGSDWLWPDHQSYKPYPHCRSPQAAMDALIEVVVKHDLKPQEIESITAIVEPFTIGPAWMNKKIEHVTDAQFSTPHGLAVAAHRIPPGKKWQSREVVFDRSVLALMEKVTMEPYPGYGELLNDHPMSRPARVEVRARGQTFANERRFAKGSPSPDPTTRMSNKELIAKFEGNAEGVIEPAKAREATELLLKLESVSDFNRVIRLVTLPADSI